jgi:hypothetical protein
MSEALQRAAAALIMATLAVRSEASRMDRGSLGRLKMALVKQDAALDRLRKFVPQNLILKPHPIEPAWLEQAEQIQRLSELENSARRGYAAVQSRLAALQASVEREAEQIHLSTGAPVDGLLKALGESKT